MGDEGIQKGVRVRISSYARPDVRQYSNAKLSGNYLISVMARREATQQGYDEAILLDPEGLVAEGSGENIFVVKDGGIVTPPTGYILPGITRDSVMKIAASLGHEIKEKNVTREDLFEADEIFFTGTAAEVTPIREINDRPIGKGKPGPITQKISERFFEIIQGKSVDTHHWLNTL
jgi:branched-chain amino acid aminotransferase